MMNSKLDIFLNKKVLIYGLGKSGLSTFEFLKNKSQVFLFDDFKKDKNFNIKKKIISYKKILKTDFDKIILSPGIDINKCKLKAFLKRNYSKIYTDLDLFNIFYKNKCITITGTNGKSTTCKLLHEVLSDQNFDVKLVGNIGNPILSTKNIKKKTFFIVEASSYQLEYSKIFTTKYAAILNLSPDHIDRHITMNNYVKAKFKLLKNQMKGDYAFVKKGDPFILKELRFNKFKSEIIKVSLEKNERFLKKIRNSYFSNEANQENLLFVLEISKKLNLRKKLLLNTIQNFNGLKYRQQIILKKRNLTIINDSKSTSFSSSIGVLKSNYNIYWLLGGVHKKGDRFDLQKGYLKNIKAYIYGKNQKFFNKNLRGKIDYENFDNLKKALKKVLIVIKKNKFTNNTILFSPCAASFDDFKNFEDRGKYFNKLVKKYFNGI